MRRPPSFAERFAEALLKAMRNEHAGNYNPEEDPVAGVVAVIDDDPMFDPLPSLKPIKRPLRTRK